MYTNEITLSTLKIIAAADTTCVEIDTPKGVWVANRALCAKVLRALKMRGVKFERSEISEKVEPIIHYSTPNGKGFFRLYSAPIECNQVRRKTARKPRANPADQYRCREETES